MTAVFNVDGIWPIRRECFMILVMNAETAEMLAFSRAEGKGSRAQVDGLIFFMTSSTSSCVPSEKSRGAGQSQTVGRPLGVAVAERKKLKKVV